MPYKGINMITATLTIDIDDHVIEGIDFMDPDRQQGIARELMLGLLEQDCDVLITSDQFNQESI